MESTGIGNGFYIVVPQRIRKKLDIKPEEIIYWEFDVDSRTIILSLDKKRVLWILLVFLKWKKRLMLLKLNLGFK